MKIPPGAPLLVDGIKLQFSGIKVLNDVSFSVTPGTVHAIIGPNGAGKSSLFNVLCGIYHPTSGSARLDELELIGLQPYRIAQNGLGRAFQNSSMFGTLTVEENLLLGRHRLTRTGILQSGLSLPRGRREERRSRELVHESARFIGVDHLLHHSAGSLPYGDAKRVDVARALCTEPRILLLDEPAAGLHRQEKDEMRSTIMRIAHELGTTILLVEHDMNLVISASDRITVLDFGNVILTGTPAEVRNDSRVIEAYLGHSLSAADALQKSDPNVSD